MFLIETRAHINSHGQLLYTDSKWLENIQTSRVKLAGGQKGR